MKRLIGPERGLKIISDLCDVRIDIPALLAKHGIDREDLSRWMQTERTQRTLAGLCMLADYQTQLMLSHYRVSAVSRLVGMLAEPKEERDENGEVRKRGRPLNPEIVRKACVDILRLNMDKTNFPPPGEEDETLAAPVDMIRKMFYGNLKKPAEPPAAEKPAA